MTRPRDADTGWVDRYRGLSIEDALSLAETERRRTRVMRPSDAVTLDWRPDRFNLVVDKEGRLIEMRAG